MKRTLLSILVLGILLLSACGAPATAPPAEAPPTPPPTEQHTPTAHTLSVSVSPSGAGSVSPSDGQYDEGTQVTLTATPASGYTFDHWSGDATGTSSSVTITMDGDKNVTAHFKAQYTLSTSVSPSGGGTITPASGTYDAGTEVTLTAIPASGYAFDHWGGGATGTSSSVTIIMDSNKSVTAHFKPQLQGKIVFYVRPPAFGTSTEPSLHSIWMIDASDAKLRKLLEVNVIRPWQFLSTPAFAISPDEESIAFALSGFLWLLDIKTGEVKKLDDASLSANVTWSPQGNQIAYVKNDDLHLINRDGTGKKRLVQRNEGKYTPGGLVSDQIRNPIWSADGKRILFDDFRVPLSFVREIPFGPTPTLQEENRSVYIYDLDSSRKRLVVSQADIVSVLPKQHKVLLNTHKKGVCIVDDDGTNLVELGENKILGYLGYQHYQWAPDGSLIIGYSSGERQWATFGSTLDIEATLPLKGEPNGLVWSPDSQYIAYGCSNELRVAKRGLWQPFTLYKIADKMEIWVMSWLK